MEAAGFSVTLVCRLHSWHPTWQPVECSVIPSQPFWNTLIIALPVLKWCCGCVFFGCFPLNVYLGLLKICTVFQRLTVCISALKKKEKLLFEAPDNLECAKNILQQNTTLSKWILCHFSHLIDLDIHDYKYKSLISEANDTKYISLSKKYFSLYFAIHHNEKCFKWNL
jgi:hypothetical protein